mgnify:FL=1
MLSEAKNDPMTNRPWLERGHARPDFLDEAAVLVTHGAGDVTAWMPRYGHRSEPQISCERLDLNNVAGSPPLKVHVFIVKPA